jgi:glycosyltransferase involved in cell wall biosynthesis
MHILFLTDNFPPEVNAPASRTFEHALEWVSKGHKVTVITCAPNFPNGQVFKGYKNKLWQSETVDGIRVVRVWTYITKNEGFLKRVLDYMSFMMSAFFAAIFIRKVDVVVGTSPQFFTACAAWAVAAVKRRPFVFELRDIWPESIRAVGAMRDSKVLDMFEKIEMFLYRRASAIVAVTYSFKNSLISRGVAAEKIHVVTNGVDVSRFSSRPKDLDLEESLNLTGKFVAGYIGTHGMAHALDTLVDAARILETDPEGQDISIVTLGNGSAREAVIKSADGLSNITFLDSVSKDQVPRYWSLLDASIIHLKKTPLFKTVIPSKLFECMGMGIPVLHGVEGESRDIVQKYNVGIPFEPESAKDLVAALKKLKANPGLHKELSVNGQTGAAHFDRTVLATDMLRVMQTLTEK